MCVLGLPRCSGRHYPVCTVFELSVEVVVVVVFFFLVAVIILVDVVVVAFAVVVVVVAVVVMYGDVMEAST